jgi:uncharacterized protein YbjT (DUF2867 family)
MHYIITGSLGNISKPLVAQLANAGHDVTVITSNAAKTAEIEQLGATAAVGSVKDAGFLTRTFTGADAVYLMVPNDLSQPSVLEHQKTIGDAYISALRGSGVKHVVLLSSIGAHLRHGAGPIDGLGYLEEQLEQLTDVNVKLLRPSYFYYNLHAMGGIVRHAGIMGGNFGGPDDTMILTHTNDIADVAAKHLLKPDFTGKSVEYVASDERTMSEIAHILGTAIGKPETPWVPFSDRDALEGMLQAGLSRDMAERYVEMGQAFREGKAQEDYLRNKPTFGKVKLEDFAQEFAAVYQQG